MPDRAALESRWLHLTRDTLPALARERGWPVHADHCFQRILLDAACGGRWYDHVAGRPAYAHADVAILAAAVALADRAAAGRWISPRATAARSPGAAPARPPRADRLQPPPPANTLGARACAPRTYLEQTAPC